MSQRVNSYKQLIFWQTAKRNCLLIARLVKELPKERAAWIISDQLLRACFSIGANIAEGFGKYKGKEYRRFIQMSLGSARETEYWLELLRDLYPAFTVKINEILALNEEVIKMLVSTVKSLSK